MKRRDLLKHLSLCLATGALHPVSGRASARPVLTMGVFPRRNIKATYRLFTPLAKHLSHELGLDIRLITTRDFESFWRDVKEQRYDIVHFNQYHYILSHKLYGYEVIAMNQEFGHSTIAGSITVRKDSGLDSVADLKGKTILFGGGPMAMQSYIAATWLLRQGGLEAGDYVEKFALNPPNAVISTYHRQADAAGSGDVVIRLDVVKRVIDVSQMKYLVRTPPLAQLPWAVRGDMDPVLAHRIQTALIDLENDLHGQTILDDARLSGIVVATDSDYDEHRRIVREVYGEDLGIKVIESIE